MIHTTVTGYKLEISPLPVYYLDFINEVYPLKEIPKRRVLNDAGEFLEFEYKLPDTDPLPGDDDYNIFIEYSAVLQYNESLREKRLKARQDFLLMTCVKVLEGEYTPESDDWVYILEAAFDGDYRVPIGKGQRLLAFLKGIVIRSQMDKELIFQYATTPEVEMQGILNALQSFPHFMG